MTSNEGRAVELAHKINHRVCGIGTDTNLILAYAAEIRREAFEAGYTQGHNDTVESCVRDYREASDDYCAAIMGKEAGE